ncbi:MAG: pseudouridine synthase [bacterium]
MSDNNKKIKLIRLDKFLANAGIGTRSEVRGYIKQRRVWLDGEVCIKAETKINVEESEITFDKRTVMYEKFIYLMMNKPKGYISATKDDFKETVVDLIDEEYRKLNVFPVGRLDRDTVGLLILSNDGRFAHNTLSPKKHIEKSYYAHINGEITDFHIKEFREGVRIKDGYKCLPAELEIEYSAENFSKIKVTIREGKYHQIKRMFEAYGRKVVYLQRLTFDEIKLDKNLAEGEYRVLNDQEMMLINKFVDRLED